MATKDSYSFVTFDHPTHGSLRGMNDNLFVTEAKNGRRSNGWRLIITTGWKRKRHAFWGSAPNRNL